MTDVFTGPPDPRDVRAKLLDRSPHHEQEEWIARVRIDDGTEAEGVEVRCRASGSLASIHPLDAQSIESAVAQHINVAWRPGHRLDVVRIRANLRADFALRGNAALGLSVDELPIPLPPSCHG
jgi:hypothetical protein